MFARSRCCVSRLYYSEQRWAWFKLLNTPPRPTPTNLCMAIPADVLTGVPVCLDGKLNYTPWYINVAAALTSVLSMIGSTMIILSYICFKQMRTPARRILLHLSLMDFVVGFANFIGTVVDFNVLLYTNKTEVPSQHKQIVEGICVAQGALALFANTSSILWTIAIAVHIYLSIMRSFAKIAANCYWIVCYGLSLILTVWFASSSKLGPSPVAGSWCSIKTVEDRSANINVFFGSNMWVYIAFIIVPVVSFSLIMHSKQQMVRPNTTKLYSCLLCAQIKIYFQYEACSLS